MGRQVMEVPEGWVVMVGASGRIVVREKEVWIHEQNGWWREDKLPKSQPAPGPAQPGDVNRGIPDDEDASF